MNTDHLIPLAEGIYEYAPELELTDAIPDDASAAAQTSANISPSYQDFSRLAQEHLGVARAGTQSYDMRVNFAMGTSEEDAKAFITKLGDLGLFGEALLENLPADGRDLRQIAAAGHMLLKAYQTRGYRDETDLQPAVPRKPWSSTAYELLDVPLHEESRYMLASGRPLDSVAQLLDLPTATVRRLGLSHEQAVNFVERVAAYYPQVVGTDTPSSLAAIETVRLKVYDYDDTAITAMNEYNSGAKTAARHTRYQVVQRYHQHGFDAAYLRSGLTQFLHPDQAVWWTMHKYASDNDSEALATAQPPNGRMVDFIIQASGNAPPAQLTQTKGEHLAYRLVRGTTQDVRLSARTEQFLTEYLPGDHLPAQERRALANYRTKLYGRLRAQGLDQEAVSQQISDIVAETNENE